jgi:hypothetical protein
MEKEKDFPIKSRVFKDKRDGTYHTQFNILDIEHMEEVTE